MGNWLNRIHFKKLEWNKHLIYITGNYEIITTPQSSREAKFRNFGSPLSPIMSISFIYGEPNLTPTAVDGGVCLDFGENWVGPWWKNEAYWFQMMKVIQESSSQGNLMKGKTYKTWNSLRAVRNSESLPVTGKHKWHIYFATHSDVL